MRFSPEDFLRVSEDILAGDGSEAHYRTVVNRAYYAAFGYAVEEFGLKVFDGSVHRVTYNTLKNSTQTEYINAGIKLELLFKKRKEADYNYSVRIKRHTSEYSIKEAKEIIQLLRAPEI